MSNLSFSYLFYKKFKFFLTFVFHKTFCENYVMVNENYVMLAFEHSSENTITLRVMLNSVPGALVKHTKNSNKT
jgi:hypothetical protein